MLNALERSQKIARLSGAWRALCSSGEEATSCPLLVILDFDRTITTADRCDKAAAKRSFSVVVVTTLMQRDVAWCAGDGGGVQAAAAGGKRRWRLRSHGAHDLCAARHASFRSPSNTCLWSATLSSLLTSERCDQGGGGSRRNRVCVLLCSRPSRPPASALMHFKVFMNEWWNKTHQLMISSGVTRASLQQRWGALALLPPPPKP